MKNIETQSFPVLGGQKYAFNKTMAHLALKSGIITLSHKIKESN